MTSLQVEFLSVVIVAYFFLIVNLFVDFLFFIAEKKAKLRGSAGRTKCALTPKINFISLKKYLGKKIYFWRFLATMLPGAEPEIGGLSKEEGVIKKEVSAARSSKSDVRT